MSYLVTGGTGYIGSHTVVELLNENRRVVIVDNLSNSSHLVLDRIKNITGKNFKFYNIDTTNYDNLEVVFRENNIESVVHFAAYKSVSESVDMPLEYYSNNIINTLTVLKLMKKYNVKNFVFSSSATVYGNPHTCPITEDFTLSAINPYGATKLMIENILRDMASTDNTLNIAILRYFNPVGAHKSGLIGEDPNGTPNNLIPYISEVALGKREYLRVFGNDYDTHDGTGVRDYIHVVDLAKGHIKALDKLSTECGLVTYNLGTGNGYSVLDMVDIFSRTCGRDIPYKIIDRRLGDVDMCYANPSKANNDLGWYPEYGINEMCEDAWRWQCNNLKGYVVDIGFDNIDDTTACDVIR